MALLDKLYHWYKMEESYPGPWDDAHGSSDMTQTLGGATYPLGTTTGWFDLAADFQDTAGQQRLGASPQWTFDTGISISMWIYARSIPDGVQATLVSKNAEYFLAITPSASKFKFRWSTYGNSVLVYSNNDYDFNTWHHMVVTYGGSSEPDEENIYVNGALDRNYTFNSDMDITAGAGTSEVGYGGGPGTRDTDAIIDDLAIWGGVLDSDDVAVLWNSGTGISYDGLLGIVQGSATGPVATVAGTVSQFTAPTLLRRRLFKRKKMDRIQRI